MGEALLALPMSEVVSDLPSALWQVVTWVPWVPWVLLAGGVVVAAVLRYIGKAPVQ